MLEIITTIEIGNNEKWCNKDDSNRGEIQTGTQPEKPHTRDEARVHLIDEEDEICRTPDPRENLHARSSHVGIRKLTGTIRCSYFLEDIKISSIRVNDIYKTGHDVLESE